MSNTYRAKAGAIAATFAILSALISSSAHAEGEVNIYSQRQPPLIEPVLKAFSDKTGIKTNVPVSRQGAWKNAFLPRVKNSPADVILTVDIARLSAIVEKGVTQPVTSQAINATIPAEYRDPSGNWFGLTKRGRVVYASKDRVAQNEITYVELADPKWKGKICSRSGQHDYNLALISSIIAHDGAEKAEAWLKGVKENLARKPEGGDRDQAKAIFAGECDLAIGNTYYVGQMLTNDKEPEQKDWAGSIKVLFSRCCRTRYSCKHLGNGFGEKRTQQGCGQWRSWNFLPVRKRRKSMPNRSLSIRLILRPNPRNLLRDGAN